MALRIGYRIMLVQECVTMSPTCYFNSAFLSVVSLNFLLSAHGMADTRPTSGWRNTLTAAYAWQGESDLDAQASFRVERGVLQFETATRFGQSWFAGFSAGYGEDRYRFSGTAGSFSPWENIRTLQFGLPLRYMANNKWTLFGLPILRYSAESDADLADGREFGLIGGASYHFSNRLTIGPGLGAFRGIGDENDLFPVLLINWRMTDTLSLETGRGLAATRGPGLTLKWRPLDKWEFGIAGRYEKYRFRLGDSAGNIGEDKSVPIVATANWQWTRAVRISALAGVETSGYLRVEDSSGAFIAQQSYNTAPIVGLVAAFQF